MKANRKNQKTLSSGEETILAARIQAGCDDATGTLTPDGRSARDELVMANVGLVYSQSNKWRALAPHLVEDLEQVGLEKLVELVASFDPAKGKFSTHAYAQIGWALGRAADTQRSSIRIPLAQCKEERATAGLSSPTIVLSLDILASETAMYPLVGSSPEENTSAAERVDSLLETSGLTPRQKQVIGLVFGLTVNPRYTQDEAADLLGISQSAVSQIVAKSLAKIKNSQHNLMAVAA